METAFRMQSMRFVAEPAIVPSSKVARLPRTVTGSPPREYAPSSIPVAIMLSLIKIIRSAPNRENTTRTAEASI